MKEALKDEWEFCHLSALILVHQKQKAQLLHVDLIGKIRTFAEYMFWIAEISDDIRQENWRTNTST